MTLMIEGKVLGASSRTFLIAELSANHDGDLDQALALVDAAADAGWDAFKLQTYTADSLTLKSDHPSLTVDAVWGQANLYDLYRHAAMPMAFHRPLFDRARERGMVPFTSIYDPRDLQFVEDLGCPVYKIASFELTFDDLLVEVAGTGKPVILSTGMANLAEVAHALAVLDRSGSGPVLLMHCVSAYPTPIAEANLAAMATLEREFGRPVGFSDHTIGARTAIIASAMGAVAIEKHITNDTGRKGPDHRFSASPDVLAEIAEGVRDVAKARGTGEKSTQPAEAGNKSVGRRSAFALRDLAAGTEIRRGDFRFVRPGAGIPPNDSEALVGRTLARSVPRGHPITYQDIAP